MVRKALITTLVLLVTYECFIRSNDISWTVGQNQWQANIIRANDLLYSDKTYTNIMVGSSISGRITARTEKDSLPSDFYSLAFDGQSSLDGLMILQSLDYVPKRVFIESNYLARKEEENLREALFSPVMYPMKKYLKSLRDRYQPVEVVSRLLTGKRIPKAKLATELVRNEKAYQMAIKFQVVEKQRMAEEKLLSRQIETMQKIVKDFQEKGTEVIFFEVPVDPVICGLARPVQIRMAVEKAFIPMKCKFIKMPDCGGYYTTDGIHLADVSIYKYLHYFRDELSR